MLCVGLLWASRIDSVIGLYLSYGVVSGFGIGIVNLVPAAVCLRWYPERKGLVSGLLTMALALGTLLFGTVGAGWLIGKVGVSSTFMALAVLFLGIIVLGSLFLRMPEAAPGKEEGDGVGLRDMLHTPSYWMIWGWMLTIQIGGLMIIGHIVPYALECGLTAAQAGLGMGVAGAAWGTAGAQLFALLWLLAFYAQRRGSLQLTLDRFRPRHAVMAEMCAVGLSPFLINVFFSVMLTAFNLLLGKYGGEMAISAMGIFFGLDSLLFMPVTGIGEGAMPIIGYNYGARNFARLRETVKIALLLSIGYYIFSEAAAMLWAEKLASFFTDDNPALIALAARCMRIGYAALPFSAVAIIVGYTLEALGRARASFCFNLIRQLVGIALIVILPRFLGVDGVWITFPAIDLVGGLAAALLLRREARNLHRTKNCGVGIKASAAHTPNP